MITNDFNYEPLLLIATNYFNYEIIYLESGMEPLWSILVVKKFKGTHWVSLFIDRNTAVYIDAFEIEYIPLELLNKIKDKSITQNIFRIQDNESVMCRFYCITFIEYMLAGKTFRFIYFLWMTIKKW